MRLLVAALALLVLTGVSPHQARAQDTGRVRIYSEPSGASVYLDDTQGAPIGTTPIRDRLPVGEYTFVLRLDGYEELRVPGEVSTRRTLRVNVDLQLAAYLDVAAGDAASYGAAIEVDGLPAGRIPARLELPSGRQLVVVRQEGFEPVEQWFDLTRGETQSWSVELGPATRGSILASADVDDAVVWLDGVEQGPAPLLLDNVPVGEHQLELRAPGRRPYAVTVTVEPGEQTTVAARVTLERGQLQIIGNVEGAEVRIDGLAVGEVPFLDESLRIGPHILEVSAEGYQPLRETVEIVAGMRRVLAIQLEPSAARAGLGARQSVIVTSDVPDARVSIDGVDLGPAPATLEDAAVGVHQIEVTAPDRQPYRTQCVIREGRSCAREAVLYEGGARLRLSVSADGAGSVEGARLLIDGRPAGGLPYDGGLPEGPVELTVLADGFETWSREVEASAGDELELRADLQPEGQGPWGLLLHSGFTVPPSLMALDLSVGWPVLLEARFDVGILPMVDVGGALRTFGRLTEIEARGRYSYSPIDLVAIGGAARLGGGGGPRGVSTFFFLLEANVSVHWNHRLAATLIQGIDFYSDGYPFAETDSDVPAAATGRQNTVSYRLGLALDAALWRGWSLWANLEWTAARTHSRRVLGDIFGTGREAERVAARLGIGFVF